MNKLFLIVPLFFIGCAGAPKFKSQIDPSTHPECIQANNFILKLRDGTNVKDLRELGKHNSTGYEFELDEFRKTFRLICENKAPMFIVDSEDFSKWKDGDENKDKDLIIYRGDDKPEREGKLTYRDSYDAENLTRINEILTGPINRLSELLASDDLKSMSEVYSFTDKFSYPDLKGQLKETAKKVRWKIVNKVLEDNIAKVLKLVNRDVVSKFLDEHYPIPLAKDSSQYKLIKESINEMNSMLRLDEPMDKDEAEESSDESRDEEKHVLWPVEKVIFGYGESPYLCGEGETCKEAIQKLLRSKDERKLLTTAYLFSVTKFNLKRSEDKMNVELNVTVDLPKLQKEFKFGDIKNYIEK